MPIYVETHHKNHCRELVRVVDISKYRSLVTISGDGLFHELLNGIMDRDDWKEAVKIPIGTISGGSANAMGKNFDTNNIILAVLNIINQQTRLMDVFSVIQNKSILYSHLTVSWTAIADIDIESEALRILGELRMTLMAIIRLTNVRMYKGVVYMLPVEEASNYKLKSPRENNYTGINSLI
jgi:sphingosine kinase